MRISLKAVLLFAGWLSLLVMLWLVFLGKAQVNVRNVIIFILIFLVTLFATAVNDSKPKNTTTFTHNRPDKN